MLHGWVLPRDTHDQVAHFQQSESVATRIEYAQRQRNDLLYWPGHVAIQFDSNNVLHATAHSLSCCVEPLAAVELRAGKPNSLWRLSTPDRYA